MPWTIRSEPPCCNCDNTTVFIHDDGRVICGGCDLDPRKRVEAIRKISKEPFVPGKSKRFVRVLKLIPTSDPHIFKLPRPFGQIMEEIERKKK